MDGDYTDQKNPAFLHRGHVSVAWQGGTGALFHTPPYLCRKQTLPLWDQFMPTPAT
jgi:hypothetical protein